MKKIHIEIYDTEVLIFESEKDFNKWEKKNPIVGRQEMDMYIQSSHGLAGVLQTEDGEGHWYIFLQEKDMSVLSHECVHIAYLLHGVLGIEVCPDNHESLAYLQGHIFKQACNKLKIPTIFS